VKLLHITLHPFVDLGKLVNIDSFAVLFDGTEISFGGLSSEIKLKMSRLVVMRHDIFCFYMLSGSNMIE